MSWRTEGKRPGKAPEPGTHRVGQGRAVNTTTGARNVREHRTILRVQAEARNALTPDHKRRAYRRTADALWAELENTQ